MPRFLDETRVSHWLGKPVFPWAVVSMSPHGQRIAVLVVVLVALGKDAPHVLDAVLVDLLVAALLEGAPLSG